MALIFDIKRFAINDGPGIRTTFFMKGCPLKCVWCHNPEGISEKPTLLYTKKKCIGCQSCVEACPQKNQKPLPPSLSLEEARELVTGTSESNSKAELPLVGMRRGDSCLLCGSCADACPTLALQLAGKEWKMEDLMEIVEKERKVMEDSGGGVTICGGEPLMHPDYLIELLTELKSRNIHRTVDTTLFASAKTVERVMSLADLFLVDLKHMNSDKHKYYTGVANEQILSNIRLISESQAHFWIRIPLIVGVNADDENLQASADFLASLPTPPEVVNLLIYHDVGKGKHARMGTTYNPEQYSMEPPSEQLQQHALTIFKAKGLNVKVGG